jgi:chaperonin cofactor prefoldin
LKPTEISYSSRTLEEIQGLPDDDEKFGAMMPLLTGLMAEAKEFKTPRVWQTKLEKEAAEQHEKLRNRVIEMEKQIYQLETALAKVGGF